MRILTLLGSPRTNGNTACVLRLVEQALKTHAVSVEHVNLIDLKIDPCRECRQCRAENADLCANTADDANALIRKMKHSDVILLAAPVFCWGFPSHTKALLDRLYCTVSDYDNNPEYSSLLEGKRFGLLATCGGPEEGNAELMLRSFYALVHFLRGNPAGHLLYPFFKTPEELTVQERGRATEFALRLIAE